HTHRRTGSTRPPSHSSIAREKNGCIFIKGKGNDLFTLSTPTAALAANQPQTILFPHALPSPTLHASSLPSLLRIFHRILLIETHFTYDKSPSDWCVNNI